MNFENGVVFCTLSPRSTLACCAIEKEKMQYTDDTLLQGGTIVIFPTFL